MFNVYTCARDMMHDTCSFMDLFSVAMSTTLRCVDFRSVWLPWVCCLFKRSGEWLGCWVVATQGQWTSYRGAGTFRPRMVANSITACNGSFKLTHEVPSSRSKGEMVITGYYVPAPLITALEGNWLLPLRKRPRTVLVDYPLGTLCSYTQPSMALPTLL
jgi:hypothetical protein